MNTHKGLFHYTWLLFGIASAPAILQRAVDMALQRILYALCYYHTFVTGVFDREHMSTLVRELEHLKCYGFQLKVSKCTFVYESVEYLCHWIACYAADVGCYSTGSNSHQCSGALFLFAKLLYKVHSYPVYSDPSIDQVVASAV